MDKMRAALRATKYCTFEKFSESIGDKKQALIEWNKMIEEDGLGLKKPRSISRKELEEYLGNQMVDVANFFGYDPSYITHLCDQFGIDRSIRRPVITVLARRENNIKSNASTSKDTDRTSIESHNDEHYELMSRFGLCTDSIGRFHRTGDSKFAAVKIRLTPSVSAHKSGEVACPFCAAIPIYVEPVRGIKWLSEEDEVDVLCASCRMMVGRLEVDPRGQGRLG